jgi:dolichol-phosphate mannosyltransferase
MKVVTIIPTYNEKENTEKMIETLAKVFSGIKDHQMELLYVDGNSPDGTAEVVRRYMKKYKWLHLLVESKKEGLGRAYAKGMIYAMEKLNADYLMEFDSDFQHRPDDIPALVSQISNGNDYIIGSRYISGGSIPDEWGFKRKFLSVVGNLVARTLLILPQIHDVTGGFKISRVKGFMDQFDFDKLLSKSFAYKVHLLYFMVTNGAKVKEVPIQFENRTSGESKLIKNELQETLRVIGLLQLNRLQGKNYHKAATAK